MKVNVNRRNWDAMVRRAPKELARAGDIVVKQVGLAIMNDAQRVAFGKDGTSLKVRTGNLRRHFFNHVEGEGGNRVLTVGVAGVPYARIQEMGGTVRAKNGKYLAIPIGPALTAAGVAKFKSPRMVPELVFHRAGGTAFLGIWSSGRGGLTGERLKTAIGKIESRSVIGRLKTEKVSRTVTRKSGGRNRPQSVKTSVVFSDRTTLETFTPWFVLKTEVRIPPRMRFRQTFDSWFPTKFQEFTAKQMKAAVARIQGGPSNAPG